MAVKLNQNIIDLNKINFNNFLIFDKTIRNPDIIYYAYPLESIIPIYAAIDIYLEMMKYDLHIRSIINTRIETAITKQYNIESASDNSKDIEIAEFVKSNFENISYLSFTRNCLEALITGYSVQEVVYTRNKNNQIVIKEIDKYNPHYFGFNYENELYLLPTYNYGKAELLNQSNFVVHKHQATKENPYGESILGLGAYVFYIFKKYGYKFWSIFIETFGQPQRIGKQSANVTDEKQRKEFADYVERIGTEGWAVLEDGQTIEFLEAKRTGKDEYSNFINNLKNELTMSVLGQTLTTSIDNKYGSRALGEVQEKIQRNIIESDCKELEETINKMIKNLIDLNYFNVEQYPKFSIEYEAEIDKTETVDWLGKLINDVGLPVSKSYCYELLNIPEPTPDEEILQKQQSLNPFMTQEQNDIDKDNGKSDIKEDSDDKKDAEKEQKEEIKPEKKSQKTNTKKAIDDSQIMLFKETKESKIELIQNYDLSNRKLEDKYIKIAVNIVEKDWKPKIDKIVKDNIPDTDEPVKEKTINKIMKELYKEFGYDDLLEYSNNLHNANYLSFLNGISTIEHKIKENIQSKQRKNAVSFDYISDKPLIPENAVQFFKNKIYALERSDYDLIDDVLKHKYFYITGLNNETALYGIQAMLQQSVEKGYSYKSFLKDYELAMEQEGLKLLRPSHIETIFRTNIQSAYNIGRYKDLMRVSEEFPYWVYVTVGDDRVRQAHAEMEGFTAYYNDPVWNYWYPPADYNCRCSVDSYTEEEFKDYKMTLSNKTGIDLSNSKSSEGFGRAYVHGDDFFRVIPDRDGNYVSENPNKISVTTPSNTELLEQVKTKWYGGF